MPDWFKAHHMGGKAAQDSLAWAVYEQSCREKGHWALGWSDSQQQVTGPSGKRVFPLSGSAEKKQGWRSWMLLLGETTWGTNTQAERSHQKKRDWIASLDDIIEASGPRRSSDKNLPRNYTGKALAFFLPNLLEARILPYATKRTPTAIKIISWLCYIYNWIPAKVD